MCGPLHDQHVLHTADRGIVQNRGFQPLYRAVHAGLSRPHLRVSHPSRTLPYPFDDNIFMLLFRIGVVTRAGIDSATVDRALFPPDCRQSTFPPTDDNHALLSTVEKKGKKHSEERLLCVRKVVNKMRGRGAQKVSSCPKGGQKCLRIQRGRGHKKFTPISASNA